MIKSYQTIKMVAEWDLEHHWQVSASNTDFNLPQYEDTE